MDIIYLIIVMIVTIIVLMYFSGWFSGLETAMTNLSLAEIADMIERKEPSATYILKLKKDMDKTLVAILIGNNIVNILLASLSALFANMLFHTLGVTIVIIIITLFTIVFCEIVPKSRGILDSKIMCIKNAKNLYVLKKIFHPLIILFIWISRKVITLFKGKIIHEIRLIGDESIKNLATLSAQEGNIKTIEKDIIHHVFYFGDRKVEDIMVPMNKVFVLDNDYSINQAREIVVKHGFTRIPYINKDKQVEGILYSKDLLKDGNATIKPLLRSPFFVSFQDDITEVFDSMKKSRIHIAIVLDHKKNHI
ncbi:DUF21 domain-containing protein [Patescibacteria group bacterium]|nr:DUF21 domain-containing protein [Patescibacteria group bacterium]